MYYTIVGNEIRNIVLQPTDTNTIVFPSTIGSNKIKTINLLSETRKELRDKFPFIDIIVEEGIENIETCAFIGLNVRKLTLPKSLKNIPNSMCSGCSQLTDVSFPNGSTIRTIDYQAFHLCPKLKKITIPASCYAIRANAFNDCGIKEVIVENESRLKSIEPYAFAECQFLKTFTFQTFFDSVITVELGNKIFANSGLETIDLSMVHITKIPEKAFFNCEQLKEVILPETVRLLGSYAFASTQIKKFDCPELLETIQSHCFYSSKLKEISLNDRLGSIELGAFASSCLEYIDNISVLSSVFIDSGAFKDCRFMGIILPPLNTDASELFAYNKQLSEVIMVEGQRDIPAGMFLGCSSLKTVNLPHSTTKIGQEAFKDCKQLRSINFEDLYNLYYIGIHAFDTTILPSVDLSNTKTYLTIGMKAFVETELEYVLLPYSGVVDSTAFDSKTIDYIKENYIFWEIDD